MDYQLLKQVSRSFYLTMRILPKSIRNQIGTAYLLARATDTIADTDIISPQTRIEALTQLRDNILGKSKILPKWEDIISAQKDSSEKVLLQIISLVIQDKLQFEKADQEDIHTVLDIITQGQLLDINRFVVNASPNKIIPLQTEEELDDYTWRVAGCVGDFWTKICRRHLYPEAPLDEKLLFKKAISFGKGLQLVNILRDLPVDLKNGRCYLPQDSLTKLGLTPEDLTHAENYKKLQTYYLDKLALVAKYLHEGKEYIQLTPKGFKTWLMRLGCSWPILIGLRTLELLKKENPLDPTKRIKVPRKEVKKILLSTTLKSLFGF